MTPSGVPPMPKQNVHARVGPAGRDGARDVAVGDGEHARPRLSDFGHQIVVSGTIENDDAHLLDGLVESLG